MLTLERIDTDRQVRPLDCPPELRRRAAALPPTQRALLEMFWDGQRIRSMARLLNLPAGTVSRRIRALLGRLSDPVVRLLVDRSNELPAQYQQIAVSRWLHGRSVRWLAGEYGLSRHEVQAVLCFVRGWAKAAGRRG
jgi:DNA-directed RNA polymerase specialized sigma24 family protein